jgi:hypothetical protein
MRAHAPDPLVGVFQAGVLQAGRRSIKYVMQIVADDANGQQTTLLGDIRDDRGAGG